MFRQAMLVSLAAGMLCAQDTKLCTIEGTITDGRSGAPVANATLILTPPAGGNPRIIDAASDATGKFTLKDLTPGQYHLRATAEGYSQRAMFVNCTVPVRSVTFALPWQGVISGRVTDQDGRAVSGARIVLLRPVYRGGNKRLVAAAGSIAGDDGQFSIDNLPAGTYYVSAEIPKQDKNNADQMYVTTFYPSAIDSLAAAPIRIRGPGEITGTDIRLLKARAFSIRGRLLPGEVTDSVRDYTVRLLPEDLRTPGPQFTIRDDRGRFQFSGVLPGTYTLVAFKDAGPPAGRLKVDIGNSDKDDVEVALNGGQTFTGVLTLEDKQQSATPGARITLQSWEDLGGILTASPKGNEFAFTNLAASIYQVRVAMAPQNYAKALRVDGRDVPDWIADLSAPQAHTLEIVMGTDAGRVSGYVRDASGDPRPKTLMTLVPAGAVPLTGPQFAATVSDDQGRYSFAGVRPGAYKVFAWENIDPGLVQNRQVLSQFETQCADVEVPPNGSANADATVIAASATASLE